MNTDSSAGITTVRIKHDDDRDDKLEQLVAIEEKMMMATKRLEAHLMKLNTKIARFPRGLRGIGGDDGRYIAPSVVAIGPYHHGSPELRKMEEVKLAATHLFCSEAGRVMQEVYSRVLSIVGEARVCYDTDDPSVKDVSDADFTAMMFNDGCFLLQFMTGKLEEGSLLHMLIESSGPSIIKDMMLLENQIPWLVVEALTEFLPVHVLQFVTDMGEKFFPKNRKGKKKETSPPPTDNLRIYKPPPHLLGLLRFSQIASMPTQMLRERVSSSLSLSRSAAELAQIGIKRTASTATWFGDMRIKKKSVCGELSLSPLFLNDITACWLFNMAALEATTIAPKWDWESDGYVVTSYLSVMAMLMDQKEDMHELRGKRVLRSIFSNTQTLAFFKRLGQHLELSRRYFATLEDIEAYKRHRPVRAAVHKFVYKYYKGHDHCSIHCRRARRNLKGALFSQENLS